MSTKCNFETNDMGVAVLKINNPPMNALDDQTMREIKESIKQIEIDDKVKVVIITGEGETFIVGADIKQVQDVNTKEECESLTSEAHKILGLIENSKKPVIAAINGACLGGGTELALACHIRIASQNAQMGFPEIMLGVMPGFGGTQRSARLLGPAKALELILTGRFIQMDEAEMIGLVNYVVPQNEALSEALKLGGSIAKKGQLAVRTIMEAVVEGIKLPFDKSLEFESKCFGRLAESEDKKEGIAAFLEKRKPKFIDR